MGSRQRMFTKSHLTEFAGNQDWIISNPNNVFKFTGSQFTIEGMVGVRKELVRWREFCGIPDHKSVGIGFLWEDSGGLVEVDFRLQSSSARLAICYRI